MSVPRPDDHWGSPEGSPLPWSTPAGRRPKKGKQKWMLVGAAAFAVAIAVSVTVTIVLSGIPRRRVLVWLVLETLHR